MTFQVRISVILYYTKSCRICNPILNITCICLKRLTGVTIIFLFTCFLLCFFVNIIKMYCMADDRCTVEAA